MPLTPAESSALLQDILARQWPGHAALGFQLRELLRAQLAAAIEEIVFEPARLFLGYSRHTYTKDPIVGLTVSATGVKLKLAHQPPAVTEYILIAGQKPAGGELHFTTVSASDLTILKVLLREAAHQANLPLPAGHTGRSFLLGDEE